MCLKLPHQIWDCLCSQGAEIIRMKLESEESEDSQKDIDLPENPSPTSPVVNENVVEGSGVSKSIHLYQSYSKTEKNETLLTCNML